MLQIACIPFFESSAASGRYAAVSFFFLCECHSFNSTFNAIMKIRYFSIVEFLQFESSRPFFFTLGFSEFFKGM